MNVGIVIQNPYPSDREVRPRKTAKFLEEEGYSTTIFASNPGQDDAIEELEYADIRRFDWFTGSMVHRFADAPSPLNVVWLAWLLLAMRDEDIKLVIGSNIRVGFLALTAAALLRQPSILDLHENNPEVARLMPNSSIVHFVTRNPKLLWVLERVCIRLATEVWVVVGERREELIKMGVDEHKVRVVSNTPYLAEFGTDQSENSEQFGWAEFTLVYVGVITTYRGLGLVLAALSHIPADESVQVVIAGDGPHREQFERDVDRFGVADFVTDLGWINAEEIPALLTAADLGLILHDVTSFTNTTIPNKLFDYMLAGLPVLTTRMKPVQRIVDRENCGEVLPLNPSPEKVADTILKLKNTTDLESLGENGREAVYREYNWKNEAKSILNSIEKCKDDMK